MIEKDSQEQKSKRFDYSKLVEECTKGSDDENSFNENRSLNSNKDYPERRQNFSKSSKLKNR